MSSSEQAPEPTMDEILASIRRIIADEPTISSQEPSPPPGEGTDAGDRGVVDDIARALSQGSDPAAAAGGDDDILDLTNELAEHQAPVPQPVQPNSGHPNPPPHLNAPAERPAPGHEAPPPAAGAASLAPQPVMPPAGAAIPPLPEGAPHMHEAPPSAVGHDPAFPPPPGGAPVGGPPPGGPPPQAFEGVAPNGGIPMNAGPVNAGPMNAGPVNAGPMNVGPGAAPPPGLAPAAHGHDDPLAAMNVAPSAPAVPVPAPDAFAGEGHYPAAQADMPPGQPPGEIAGFGAPPNDQAVYPSLDLGAVEIAPEPLVQPEMRHIEAAVSEAEFDLSLEFPDEVNAQAEESSAIDVEKADTNPTATENSFEKSIKAMMKPMLRDWLDDNMPRILEGAMKDEMGSRGGNKGED